MLNNHKGHFIFSMIKSLTRILGCFFAIFFRSIIILSLSLSFAEVIGILEELVDKNN